MANKNNTKRTPPKAAKPAAKAAVTTEPAADTKAVLMSPAKVAAIAKAEAREVVGKQVTGFGDFIRDQGVIGVGVGLVLGIQVKAVVDTIMASFVNPVTELLLPGKEALSAKEFMLSIGDKQVAIGWGAIVYSIFTFIMVAVIVYAGYKLLKLDKFTKKKEEAPEEKKAKKKK